MTAEMTTTFIDVDGYTWELTLTGSTWRALLPEAKALREALKKAGCKPAAGSNEESPANGAAEERICRVHHARMARRTGRGGDTWYSHKAVRPDGTEYWCRGEGKGG